MLLRVRSKEGMHRIQVEPQDTFASFAEKIAKVLNMTDVSTLAMSDQPNTSNATSIMQLANQSLASANLKHGDIVYITYVEPVQEQEPVKTTQEERKPQTTTSGYIPIEELSNIKQDAVDDFLEKQRGLIQRSKDTKFCRHGSNAMCDYCMPLEPYDQGYLEENKIKHMSFHAYLRQINSAQQTKAPSSAIVKQLPPLEEPNYKVKVPCTGGHAPWPEGICTKCQPSAITLQRQTYRAVDHVEFSSAALIDNFIHYWRESGCQRFGYMYGRYEPYLDVPLGIKAVVEAIYEPPQETHVDGLKLDIPWAEEKLVNQVAEACGLVKIGMIFTDLTDDGTGKGTVYAKRHVDSYFLSSLECCFAAEMQRRHPNYSRHSATGKYSSKFVTCVVSGDVEGNIDVTAYQVSDTMTAMHEAGIVEPSRKPSVMRVKESIPHERYVPEVFYKFKNEYNVMVKEPAKPTFPVEYLLVNVTNGFPQNPNVLFKSTAGYVVENRPGVAHQDMGTLSNHLLHVQSSSELKQVLSDFHLLCSIRSTEILGLAEFKKLCEIATQPNQSADELEHMEGWNTLIMVLKTAEGNARANTPAAATSSAGPSTSTPAVSATPVEKSCRHCTFANPGTNVNCEMCGLPLDE
ncbi:NPL4 family-domain-containing protein [Radiomyces spectabilis]|uniref:NPL4 family-domain-containing protein n=1 Tax=Radiomyces spectabilis TaxID=64574 RepID=UPI00221F4AC6|nr:NPL4 family-domain-containing protein [Radiomyces spectabilis]KAI8393556.1 NPL4 family-domain-containing protein [Radiomyces spectabilis]